MKKTVLKVIREISEVTGSEIYKILKNGEEVASGNNLKRLLEVYGQI